MKYQGDYEEFFKGNEHCVHITNGRDSPEIQDLFQIVYEIANITIDEELRWNDANCGFKLPYICKQKGIKYKKIA